jgi:hypothetical protein
MKTTITITITSDASADVSFADSGPELVPGELDSLAGVTATQQFVPQQIVAIPPKQVCPTHGVSRLVPSGVTKQGPRAGQIYPAFWACDTAKGVCSWKA